MCIWSEHKGSVETLQLTSFALIRGVVIVISRASKQFLVTKVGFEPMLFTISPTPIIKLLTSLVDVGTALVPVVGVIVPPQHELLVVFVAVGDHILHS